MTHLETIGYNFVTIFTLLI